MPKRFETGDNKAKITLEAQLKRMAGLDDGIVDAVFTYSRPLTDAYFWRPPIRDGKLDLRALGLS